MGSVGSFNLTAVGALLCRDAAGFVSLAVKPHWRAIIGR